MQVLKTLLRLNFKSLTVGLFSFLKKRRVFFSAEDNAQIVEAIRSSEKSTSGEIRIYVESKNPLVEPLERAAEVFLKLKMEKTEHRNAVLLYIAMDHREIALYGDEGIYQALGKEYWDNVVRSMLGQFTKQNISNGIVQCILNVGQALKEKFPYDSATDKNELPDEIVFGN